MEICVSTAAARRLYVPESAHVARTFLAELRQVHRELMAQIDRLEAMTCDAEPDRTALTTLRWKLGQASLARRLLAGRICEYFEERCDAEQVALLRDLRRADQEMLRLSAAHLAKWSADNIFGDWPAFCREGRAMRRKSYDHIALEQRVLYPVLEQAAQHF
jgi:hypothetical protein